MIRLLPLILLTLLSQPSWADIYHRWDREMRIPETEGIVPGPDVQLDRRELAYASLDGFDLSRANFEGSNLSWASANGSDLTDANLSGANLSNADLLGANLTEADLSGATIQGIWLGGVETLTKEQLYSTASYADQDLRGIRLGCTPQPENASPCTNMNGWDLTGQDLTGAGFTFEGVFGPNVIVSDVSFVDANLANSRIEGTFIRTDFSRAVLTGAYLVVTALDDVDFSDAVIQGAIINSVRSPSHGISSEHLYSTASYKAKDLSRIGLTGDLSGWDFHDQNLTNASFFRASLANANLAGANLKNAYFNEADELTLATFSENTVFNQWTVFPSNFDPIAAGLTLFESPVGDIDADDVLDVDDIDLLTSTLIDLNSLVTWWIDRAAFDLNSDNFISLDDRTIWVHELKSTYFGDANLDGEFNSGDLADALAAGTYEMDIEAGWAAGDFDGNGRFDSGDLVLALTDGGYEQGPRAAVSTVPEPSTALLFAFAATFTVSTSRRKQI